MSNNEDGSRMVLVEEIRPSKTNPRKRFDEQALADLTASIKEKGVMVPLIVRPITPETVLGSVVNFELVAGERRYRACVNLQIEQVRCEIRNLSDQEALEWQIIENLQRDDLDEIEEAEGYEQLLSSAQYKAEDLAKKLGKGRDYIYRRLKLLLLPANARKALLDGRIGTSIAELIARVPNKPLREECAKIVIDPTNCKVDFDFYRDNYDDKGPMTYREAFDMIQERYMRELKGAPFDQKDPKLNPEMGPCTTCPLRTGNSPEIFGDVKRGDICTNPACFEVKRLAARKIALDAAVAKGFKVLDEKKSEKLFSGSRLNYNARFVKADEKPDGHELREGAKATTWRAMTKGQEVPIVVALDEEGNPHELIDKELAVEAVTAAAKAKGEKPILRDRQTSAGSYDHKAEQAKRKLQEERDQKVFAAIVPKLIEVVEKKGNGELFIDGLVAHIADVEEHQGLRRTLARRGIKSFELKKATQAQKIGWWWRCS